MAWFLERNELSTGNAFSGDLHFHVDLKIRRRSRACANIFVGDPSTFWSLLADRAGLRRPQELCLFKGQGLDERFSGRLDLMSERQLVELDLARPIHG